MTPSQTLILVNQCVVFFLAYFAKSSKNLTQFWVKIWKMYGSVFIFPVAHPYKKILEYPPGVILNQIQPLMYKVNQWEIEITN